VLLAEQQLIDGDRLPRQPPGVSLARGTGTFTVRRQPSQRGRGKGAESPGIAYDAVRPRTNRVQRLVNRCSGVPKRVEDTTAARPGPAAGSGGFRRSKAHLTLRLEPPLRRAARRRAELCLTAAVRAPRVDRCGIFFCCAEDLDARAVHGRHSGLGTTVGRGPGRDAPARLARSRHHLSRASSALLRPSSGTDASFPAVPSP